MKIREWAFPIVLLILCAAMLIPRLMSPKDTSGEMRIHDFGRLPVVYQGRVKPFDTVARNGLVVLSGKQTYKDSNGTTQPAIRWLLDTISLAPDSFKNDVFRIDNLQLLDKLKLVRRKGFRFSYMEFQGQLESLQPELQRIFNLDQRQQDTFDRKVIELYEKIQLYRRFAETHRVAPIETQLQRQQELDRQERLMQVALPYSIPPLAEGEEWQPFMRAAYETIMGQKNLPVELMARMLDAYKKVQMVEGDGKAEPIAAFNTALTEYESWLAANPLKKTELLGFEVSFNHFAPFFMCAIFYVIAFLLSCFSWLGRPKLFNRAAFCLMGFAAVIHTGALIARIFLSGYPPVTNLYSSAIFIGWGCVILGLGLEYIFKIGVGNVVASVSGFLTLIIAHFLAGDGDTMEMMQAVLDTKFWLATHVTTVTLGYTATFFAGGIGIFYILRGVLTKSLTKEDDKSLSRMIYGVVCFALLLSFVGTVLGGLWADDSWGRFWGWDPKENGALIIVLWNAVILHARWGGLIRNRGIAVLAVLGNIVTAWSWFGVNQLGAGLHSYGFTNSAADWLRLFYCSQLLIVGLGLYPLAAWRSFSKNQPGAKKLNKDVQPGASEVG